MQNLQNPFGQMQNLQKVHLDKCRTYKSPFGQMQNLQKSIRTNAELTKISKKFGQMHAPHINTSWINKFQMCCATSSKCGKI